LFGTTAPLIRFPSLPRRMPPHRLSAAELAPPARLSWGPKAAATPRTPGTPF